MSLTSIKELAENDFESFLDSLHEDYPELVLKYQITQKSKNDFIEAVLRQVWIQRPYDRIEILEYMAELK